ncbi:MAG: oligoendopeptidase F [Chloroflexi bacterium]|nr:oligoendopeptidase F [Chloroflexota bacterium]
MSDTTARERSEIPIEFTWNAESVFPDRSAWSDEFEALAEDLALLEDYHGRLSEGPKTLLEAIGMIEDIVARAFRLLSYAYVGLAVDSLDPQAVEMYGRVQGLVGQALGALAFMDPELIAAGEDTVKGWIDEDQRLAKYDHYVNNLFRKQKHVRSQEVEELLGTLQGLFLGARTTAEALADSDFTFRPATAADGTEIPFTQGTLRRIYTETDREARRTAWENYADQYRAFKNTLASNLTHSIRQNVFSMRARKHESTLEMALFENNIPVEVFYNLIETFRANVGTWHRYFSIKRQALGFEEFFPYDVWAPLTPKAVEITYPQAVDWICEGMRPLGDDYVQVMRSGSLEQRWVDVYPNKGKRQGAFSFGSPGTYPFIVMSYNDNALSFSTLAHELGHSMHSYLAWETQPVLYSRYSIFAAEVASNFNQAMVRGYLLDNIDDRALMIALIEEAMANFYRYFFVMPTLARFELETHERIERGEGLNADSLIELMADLFEEPYGSAMVLDRERVGITWAQFHHLYADYYVYQYATGIAGAHALVGRILDGEPGAAEDYLGFLKAGGSEYPLDALKTAGVDLSSPEPVEQAFSEMAGYVDRLEQLLS